MLPTRLGDVGLRLLLVELAGVLALAALAYLGVRTGVLKGPLPWWTWPLVVVIGAGVCLLHTWLDVRPYPLAVTIAADGVSIRYRHFTLDAGWEHLRPAFAEHFPFTGIVFALADQEAAPSTYGPRQVRRDWLSGGKELYAVSRPQARAILARGRLGNVELPKDVRRALGFDR